jgi:hypothetical protein
MPSVAKSASFSQPTVIGKKSDSATIARDQQDDSDDDHNSAIDGPLRLTRHEAARKDVDSLKNPDASREQT